MTSRSLLSLALGLAGLVSSAQGAAYSTNFNGFNPQADVAGQEGWAINDATPALSFLATLNGSQAGALGGFLDAPIGSSVELTHAYALALAGASFDVDLDVEPSTAAFPGRDTFGWSFRDGANSLLMAVIFKPNVNVANQLEVLWQGPTGGAVSTGTDLLEQGLYHLAIDFGANGANGTFSAQLIPSVGAPLNWNGALAGVGAATIARFGADWDVNGQEAGDNFMIFDNLAMVPEPSGVALLGLSLFGAMRRRRGGR